MIYLQCSYNPAPEILRTLLKTTPVNQVSLEDGESVLHKAAWNPFCQTKTLEFLLEHGADINYTDEQGYSVLQAYLDNCRLYEYKSVQCILRHGFNVKLLKDPAQLRKIRPEMLSCQIEGRLSLLKLMTAKQKSSSALAHLPNVIYREIIKFN
jgi:hypothetical protein